MGVQVTTSTGSLKETGGGSGGGSSAPPGLVLLAERVASSSASLEFLGVITSAYDDYLLEILNMIPPSGSVSFGVQVSTDGGSTWLTTGYVRMGVLNTSVSSSLSGVSDTGSRLDMGGTIEPTGGGLSGSIKLRNPLNTREKEFSFESQWHHTDTNRYGFQGHFFQTNTSAFTAIRCLMDSGNIASGIARLYGLKKA